MNLHRIKKHSIEEVVSLLNLEPGSNGKYYTPLGERTPSVAISTSKQIFKGFSTGVSGDLIALYQHYANKPFKDAIIELDNYLNGSTYRPAIKQIKFSLSQTQIDRHKLIQKKIFKALYLRETRNFPDRKIISDLTERQKFDIETLERFRWFTITNVPNTISWLKGSFTVDELNISGLFSDKGYFYFTSHRLIIPYIVDDEIIYLRARATHKTNMGKYVGLNNRSTTLSAKQFYNVDLLSDVNEVYINEGEKDVLASAQLGYDAIGIGGVSNFPFNDIEKLRDKKVTLLYDNDAPGNKASSDHFLRLKKEGIDVSELQLIEHKDISEALQFETS